MDGTDLLLCHPLIPLPRQTPRATLRRPLSPTPTGTASQGPEDLDKSLETAENFRIRSTSKDRHMLTTTLYSCVPVHLRQ